MRIPMILCFVVCATGPARGAYLAETAYSSGTRVESGTTSGSIAYALNSGQLEAAMDGRSGGTVEDFGLKFFLPPATAILSATLSLNLIAAQNTTNSYPSVNGTIVGYAATSAALALTDFSLPSSSPVSFTVPTSTTVPLNDLLTFDVTSYLQTLLATPTSAVGFRIAESTQQVGLTFSTPTDPTAALRPTLSITYATAVPEPSSLLLVGMSLLIGAGSRYYRATR